MTLRIGACRARLETDLLVRVAFCLVLLIAPVPLSLASTVELERTVWDVPMHISVRPGPADPGGSRAREAAEAAFARAKAVGDLLLLASETSEIGILNHVPAHVSIAISQPTADALRRALQIAAATGGAYDPTLPPLLRVWGLATPGAEGGPKVPSTPELDRAVKRVYWENIEVEDDELVARRTNRRTETDLDALARGAMIDAALATLRAAGLPAALVRSPGLTTAYAPEELPAWSAPGPVEATSLELRAGGLAIAAPRREHALPDGTRIHELIDPRSGRPARGVRAVLVVAEDARSAAGYARAVFAMGGEGPSFVESRPDLRAVIVVESGETWSSPGLSLEPQSLPKEREGAAVEPVGGGDPH